MEGVFEWHRPKVSAGFRATLDASREQMLRRDIELRAGLLMRLGRTRANATATCQRLVGWEFEGLPVPRVLSNLEAIVNAVYDRNRA